MRAVCIGEDSRLAFDAHTPCLPYAIRSRVDAAIGLLAARVSGTGQGAQPLGRAAHGAKGAAGDVARAAH